MAYDTKSDVGKQISNPGKVGDNQLSIFKNNVAESQLPLYRNVQIDLLSMEQFGQNISKLRKNLSITDATQVNTDKEYGIIQIEDDFDFVNLPGEPITDSSQAYTEYSPNVYKKATCTEASELATSGNIKCAIDGAIFPCQIFSVRTETDDIYGLQYLKTGTYDPGIGLKINNADISPSIDESSMINSNNEIVKDSEEWVTAACARGDYVTKITLSATCLQDGFSVKSLIRYKANDADTWQSSSPLVFVDFDNGTSVTSTGSWNGFDDFLFHVYSEEGPSGSTSKSSVSSYVNIFDRTDNDLDVQQFATKLQTGVVVGYTDGRFPECDIRLEITNNKGDLQSHTWIIRKPSNISSYPKTRLLDSIGNIFDWSYNTYFQGIKTTVAGEKIECSMIKSGVTDTFLTNSPTGLFGFIKGNSVRSSITSFYRLVSVNGNISIGFIRRVGDTAQMCVRYYLGDNNIKYTTSMNDSPIPIESLNIKEINIIGSSGNHVDFIVLSNTGSMYYSFYTSDMVNGNKLISNSKDLLVMQSLDPNKTKNNQQVNFDSVPTVAGSATCQIVATDDNLYENITNTFKIDLCVKGVGASATGATTQFIISSVDGLKNSVLSFIKLGTYVSSNLTLYLPCVYNYNAYMYYSNTTKIVNITEIPLSYFKHLASVNAIDVNTDSFASLPLRMEDEYPEIYNRSSVCDKSFIIGKTNFVSHKGTLYEGGSLRLCPNTNRIYLYEADSIMYLCSQYIFTSKTNLTNVYSFTELGMQLSLTIEDEVVCNPVMTSTGIIMCGRTGIWVMSKEGCAKVWQSSNRIDRASLKTDLDNSCVAVIDNEPTTLDQLVGLWDGVESPIVGLYNGVISTIGKERPKYAIVTINQFGYISEQRVQTEMIKPNFIDVGATAELVIIDTVNKDVNVLDKAIENTSTEYSIQSNQQIEMYQETVYSDLVSIKLFAKGIGTIQLYLNGVSERTIDINSTRYEEYRINVYHPMNMIDYKLVVSKDVKLMQKVIGIISIKEEFYG